MTRPVTSLKPLPFEKRIRQARAEAGITTEALARKLGVSTRTVAGWQAGRSRPSYERLVHLAELLGKPPSYFLERVKRAA